MNAITPTVAPSLASQVRQQKNRLQRIALLSKPAAAAQTAQAAPPPAGNRSRLNAALAKSNNTRLRANINTRAKANALLTEIRNAAQAAGVNLKNRNVNAALNRVLRHQSTLSSTFPPRPPPPAPFPATFRPALQGPRGARLPPAPPAARGVPGAVLGETAPPPFGQESSKNDLQTVLAKTAPNKLAQNIKTKSNANALAMELRLASATVQKNFGNLGGNAKAVSNAYRRIWAHKAALA